MERQEAEAKQGMEWRRVCAGCVGLNGCVMLLAAAEEKAKEKALADGEREVLVKDKEEKETKLREIKLKRQESVRQLEVKNMHTENQDGGFKRLLFSCARDRKRSGHWRRRRLDKQQ